MTTQIYRLYDKEKKQIRIEGPFMFIAGFLKGANAASEDLGNFVFYQATGILDSTGSMIFESDTLICESGPCRVIFEKGAFYVASTDPNVVGNPFLLSNRNDFLITGFNP